MARRALGTRAARRVLTAGRQLAESLQVLTSVPESLRARARAQRERLRAQLAYEQLRTAPLSDLRTVTSRNLRLADVERAGWSTVLDVLRARPEELQQVHGVGPQTATAIRQAAADLLTRITEEIVVRIDPDARTQDAEDLLRTLRMLLEFDRARRPADSAADSLAGVLHDTLRRARPAGSWWRMVLGPARTRQSASTALNDLQVFLDSPANALVRRTAADAVGVARKAERLPAGRLWSDYQRNAAAYTTLLYELDRVGPDGDTRASQGFVPEEIAREAGDTELDTSLLTVQLRRYQAFGAKFVLARRRCVLGDEMGLGKTVQAIAVLAHSAARGGRHFLVVCPASVLVNWIGEVGRHCTLPAHQAHGTGRDAATARWIAEGGVAVTTFETLRRLPLPAGFRPDFLVVDEAHYIKNPLAQRTRAVNAVAERAPGVLMMTGTPLENRVEEFRDLVSYLDPGLAETITVADGTVGAREFRRRVAPVYLRRNQEDVLSELPQSLELEDWVALGGADEREYAAAVAAGNFAAMRRATVVNQSTDTSAKLERLVEIVEESAASGWKVVVFSFFLDVLSQVAAVLATTGGGVKTFQLSGRVPAAERQRIVDEFSAVDGCAVLVSQITAGGVGLNIQAASVVILTEPQLKPTIEAQAIARCRRMGQTRRVRVHRLLAKDTVDERLLEILGTKSALIEAYARDSDAKLLDPAAVDGRLALPRQEPGGRGGAGERGAGERGAGERGAGERGAAGELTEGQLKQRIVAAERQRLGMR